MPSIRIATLNLWNTDLLLIERLRAAADALARLDADVVALQEVRMRLDDDSLSDAATFLGRRIGFPFMEAHPFPGNPDEGLAFLSKYPPRVAELGAMELNECALRVTIEIEGVTVSLTNVHLDWASVSVREREIIAIADIVTRESSGACQEILLGDFNSYPESSVSRFLAGQQTLHGHETVPWHDLASTWAAGIGATPAPTLDFRRNPRWRDTPKLDRPARCDWVLARDTFASGLDSPSLTNAGIFGDRVSPGGIVPSDHYGVFADLALPPRASESVST